MWKQSEKQKPICTFTLQFVESRVNALNDEAAIDDLFEEELDQRTSSGE